MLTSLFVISVKSYRLSCGFYACQSLVLVSIFATLSCLFAAEQLLIWSASAFITKVLLVPLIMTYAARNIPRTSGKSVIRSGNDGTARGVNCPALRICRSAREATDGYRAETGAGGSVRSFSAWPAVHCQPAQYPAANFWLLPDGKRLPSGAGASCLASTGTWVEIGIATDAIFAVIVMVLLARKIWRTHGTLDVNNLTALKG